MMRMYKPQIKLHTDNHLVARANVVETSVRLGLQSFVDVHFHNHSNRVRPKRVES